MLGGLIHTPPNFYQETDIDVPMQIVENYRSQFANTKIAGVVCAEGIAVGYLFLTLYLTSIASESLSVQSLI